MPPHTAQRPTIRLDGQADEKVSSLVLGMQMTEKEGGLSSLELTLSNVATDTSFESALAFEDETSLRLGMDLAVYAGDEGRPQEIFRGPITGIEAQFGFDSPPELTVLAEDACQKARMTRRTRVFEDATLKSIAETIAGEMSLDPVVTGFTDNIGTQVQLDESNLAFLRRVLARYDGDVQVVGSELHVSPRADVQRGAIPLVLYEDLARVRAIADLACQPTQVTLSGWDAKQGQRVSATGAGARLGPGSGRTGKQILSQTLGDRSEHLGHLAVSTQEEAQAIADAAMDRHARRFVRLDATAFGNPALRVGAHIEVSGISPRFDNTYYIVEAVHRWDARESGYETDFIAECAFLNSV
jgi:phage protein D